MPDPTSEPGAGAGPTPAAGDGRARLLAALRHPGSRGQVVAGLLLALVGFAGVAQVSSNRRDDGYLGARQSDLIQYINTLSLSSERTQSEIARLQATRDSLGSDAEARRTALTRAREQAQTLGILAGTLPAEGPGVRITVTDKATAVGTNQLLDGLEELRDAGAEVIEINDEVRVIAQTYLKDVSGGGVVVDGERIKPPYVIDAIGDPQTLATALDFPGGFSATVRDIGGTVGVEQLKTVRVASVRTAKAPRYADPG